MHSVSPERKPSVLTEALAYLDPLYAYAWRLARNEAVAEDLVQETFARCTAAQERFEAGTNLKAWLFRILRNSFIDLQRRNQRSPVKAVFDEDASAESAPASDPLRGDHELERLRLLVGRDLEAALAQLTEEQRSVVLLDLEGFSEQEIASVLACAPGTIKSRLARARGVLRAQLWEYAR